MNIHLLRESLERLYRTYGSEYLSQDPVCLVHDYPRSRDQEVAGLISSVFAYGQVGQILKTVRTILGLMQGSPYDFVLGFDATRDARRFTGIVHRFNKGVDIVCLLLGISQVLRTHGSLKNLFLQGYSPDQPDVETALSQFVDRLLGLDYSPVFGSGTLPEKAGLRFLLPHPGKGSACKRLNMYLRWMVREDHGVDLGIWPEVSPAQLILPLDTHLFRISTRMGLTRRRAANWAAAKEITQTLRLLDPSDPVKYDFALARLGILKECTAERVPGRCRRCMLGEVCEINAGDEGAHKPATAVPGQSRRYPHMT